MASNDESINDDNDNLDFTIPLGNRENRRTYLITYAQADLLEVPSCLSFSELVLDGFNSGKSTRHVQEWACCKEPHQDGGGPLPHGSETEWDEKVERCQKLHISKAWHISSFLISTLWLCRCIQICMQRQECGGCFTQPRSFKLDPNWFAKNKKSNESKQQQTSVMPS